MKLTKDELRIIAECLSQSKYDFSDGDTVLFSILSDLEVKINKHSEDKRRNGRKSQNNWSDLIKRLKDKKTR
jgi:hypothetical protein